jgi:hypothetical protein
MSLADKENQSAKAVDNRCVGPAESAFKRAAVPLRSPYAATGKGFDQGLHGDKVRRRGRANRSSRNMPILLVATEDTVIARSPEYRGRS